jgi:hypothetical protein
MNESGKSSLGSACATGLVLIAASSASVMDAAPRTPPYESSAARMVCYETLAAGGTGTAKHDEEMTASVLPVWLPRGSQSALSDYLASIPGADGIVSQLKSHVRRVFGDLATVTTELVVDPSDGAKQAFVVIATAVGLEEGDRLLRQLEDEWWLEAMPSDGSVALELKFV